MIDCECLVNQMGRTKLSMKLIGNEKARYVTFQKRKRGLKKKTFELKTLCGVDVCLIVYGPKTDDQYLAEPELWPPNRVEVEGLIESYKKQSVEDRKRRSVDLSNFFEDRSRKVEDELVKLRKKNQEARYTNTNRNPNRVLFGLAFFIYILIY
ncbi:hypothetical protein U1Q18_028520 [Sarracenia purpurea var. burkii]